MSSMVRLAWYALPTMTGHANYLVGAPLGTQCLAVPSDNRAQTPDRWLESACQSFYDPVLDTVPTLGDIITIAQDAYQWTSTGWIPVSITHAQATSLTAGRPLAYGISPLAPRGAYTQADHQAIGQRFARWIWDQGLFPVLPHLYLPQFLDDTLAAERTVGLQLGQTWLIQSTLVLQLDVPCSSGMAAERQLAKRYGRPIEVVPWDALEEDSPYVLE